MTILQFDINYFSKEWIAIFWLENSVNYIFNCLNKILTVEEFKNTNNGC